MERESRISKPTYYIQIMFKNEDTSTWKKWLKMK